jgi:hypothetical protein
MSFVVCYLPGFGQCLITHVLSAFLPFQCLFTDGLQQLAPPFSNVFSEFLPLLLCASFQFIVYCSIFFFLAGGVSLPRGLCWFIPGVSGGIPHDST